MNKLRLLNLIIALIGIAIMFLGLNIGLGGIKTLGWQTAGDFVAISDIQIFNVQDNHIRFVGGVWFGVGATFLLGAFAINKLRPTLIALSLIIAIAGLFRLSAANMDVILSPNILPSLALELVAFPLLAWWLAKSPAQ